MRASITAVSPRRTSSARRATSRPVRSAGAGSRPVGVSARGGRGGAASWRGPAVRGERGGGGQCEPERGERRPPLAEGDPPGEDRPGGAPVVARFEARVHQRLDQAAPRSPRSRRRPRSRAEGRGSPRPRRRAAPTPRAPRASPGTLSASCSRISRCTRNSAHAGSSGPLAAIRSRESSPTPADQLDHSPLMTRGLRLPRLQELEGEGAEQGREHLLLASEVPVQAALGEARRAREVVHRRHVVALLGEAAEGGGEDLRAALLGRRRTAGSCSERAGHGGFPRLLA